jgi:hypothetical protein
MNPTYNPVTAFASLMAKDKNVDKKLRKVIKPKINNDAKRNFIPRKAG